jgi:hypothetical protein
VSDAKEVAAITLFSALLYSSMHLLCKIVLTFWGSNSDADKRAILLGTNDPQFRIYSFLVIKNT